MSCWLSLVNDSSHDVAARPALAVAKGLGGRRDVAMPELVNVHEEERR